MRLAAGGDGLILGAWKSAFVLCFGAKDRMWDGGPSLCDAQELTVSVK